MYFYNRNDYILEESPLKQELLRLFKSKDKLTILDIGGCEGEESIRYSRIFPNSKIFIFEPLPKNVQMIKEHLLNYNITNVTLMPLAVSDDIGVASFYVSKGHPKHESEGLDWDFGNKSSSLLIPEKQNNHDWLSFEEKIDIQTITLDSFLDDTATSKIDFIHMDVQGAELKVLHGAKKGLKNMKAIWLEVSNIELYKNQPLRCDIELFMKENNFELVKSEMQDQTGDQLYLNKKYFKVVKILSKQFYFTLKK